MWRRVRRIVAHITRKTRRIKKRSFMRVASSRPLPLSWSSTSWASSRQANRRWLQACKVLTRNLCPGRIHLCKRSIQTRSKVFQYNRRWWIRIVREVKSSHVDKVSTQTIRSSSILSSLSPLITTTITTTSTVQVPSPSTIKAEIALPRNQNARHLTKLAALYLTVDQEKIYMMIKKWSLLLKRTTIWLQHRPWLTMVNSRFHQPQLNHHLVNKLATNISSDSPINVIANRRWISTIKRWHSASLFNNWLEHPSKVENHQPSINTSISI